MPKIIYKNKTGQRLSGVTTIIGSNLGWSKGPLMWWANNEGLAGRKLYESTEATDAGTLGHHLIECDIKGLEANLDDFPEVTNAAKDKAETSYLNYLEWKRMVNFRPIATEVQLVSEEHQYGGMIDCIGVVTSKRAIIDWKASNGVYEDMLLQLSAYRVVWEENNPDKPIEGGYHLLRISKTDASFHHHHWSDLSKAWETFMLCLQLHKIKPSFKGMT